MRLLSPNAARVLATFLAAPTGSFYGYELLQETGIKSGSLYPVLGRFESLGWIQGEMQESPGSRPARRVYRLDPSGTADAQAALDRVLEERQQSLQDLGVLGI